MGSLYYRNSFIGSIYEACGKLLFSRLQKKTSGARTWITRKKEKGYVWQQCLWLEGSICGNKGSFVSPHASHA
jgi:hypothetical protein